MSADAYFKELLDAVPEDLKSKCAVHPEDRHPYMHCYFGAPPRHGRDPLRGLPVETEGISFFGVPDQPELVRAFCESYHAQNIESVTIGGCSYAKGAFDCDYSSSVASLRGASLPRLRELELGVWELFHNAETVYGRIGDVTDILTASAKRLESLNLSGHFELSRSVSLHQLKSLELWSLSSITDPYGGTIEPESFAHLLASEMPELRSAELHPYCEVDRTRDALPPGFLDGTGVPSLSRLEISAEEYDAVALERVLDSALLQRPGIVVFIEGIPELPGVDALRGAHRDRPGMDWKFEEGGVRQDLRLEVPPS